MRNGRHHSMKQVSYMSKTELSFKPEVTRIDDKIKK